MERAVRFNSDGVQIAGVLFEPEAAAEGSCPGVVMCQGMIGVKEYFWFPTIARRLAELGYVALIWDYRGVGESEGEPGRLYPLEQSEDIRNGLTFLETNPLVDPGRLALLGFSFGGGMVPYVAAVDERVKCGVSVVGWGDGRRWMQSVRRHGEWLDLLRRIDADRKTRVVTGKSELMGPLGGILVGDPATAAAREAVVKTIPEMESGISTDYSLATAEKLLEFKPVEVVARIAPRAIMFIAAELDAVTPADHVVEMYERASEPKKLWVIPGAAHYDVYLDELREKIFDMSVAWMAEHMPPN
ncbi:MAG: alpha/beta fold hydrolase [Alphaproteobacteria bacterium]|nr:alpha/beta fold hydrolase [Alphaproteobacteria bacterium]